MNAETKIEADPANSLELALSKALPELENAKKRSANPHFKSRYADLASVIEAIRPAADHGIWFRQVLHECERGVTIETLYTGFGSTISAGSLFMPVNKADAQASGSALTYARRYALQAAFGLASEDDDGNAAALPPKAAPKAALLNDGQWAELAAMLEASQSDVAAFCKAYGVGSLKDLPADRFDHAKARVAKKLEGMAANA